MKLKCKYLQDEPGILIKKNDKSFWGKTLSTQAQGGAKSELEYYCVNYLRLLMQILRHAFA